MELGYVYVLTTHSYLKRNIFKIGCTKNLYKRLKELNATRFETDKFFVKMFWMTKRYYDLECGIHRVLKDYRKNNEFFQCLYQDIESGVKLYLSEKSVDYVYDDAVLIPAFLQNLRWVEADNRFYINEYDCISEEDILHKIKDWLSIFDYGLFQFVHESFWDSFLQLLKLNFRQNAVQDLHHDINDLCQYVKFLFIQND